MISSASTEDNDNFQEFRLAHVFLVKAEPGPDHWLRELPEWVTAVVNLEDR